MKKALSYALCFMMVISMLVFPNIEANAANVSLGVSASTINIGDTVTVTVTVPDNVSATVDLSFTSSVLSFVSASADVGANGGTITMNVGKYSLAASNSVSVTFKASTSGTASVSAAVISAVDNDTAEEVSVGGASTSITVANQSTQQPATTPGGGEDTSTETAKSADNSLASLKLSSGTLSPSFVYNVTNYTATVGYNVSSLVVSATPSNGKATIESVTGNGNVNLQVGENTIQVVVKAENGVKATYTVVVTRLAEEDTTGSSEGESESESQEPVVSSDVLQWNGQKLEPAETVPEEVVPADFSATTVMINSVETPCLTFANGNLKVLYLKNEEGTEALYVYDEEQQVVYPFVKIDSENNYVMVLLPDEANAPAPEYYSACTLSIEGKGVINAYQFVQPASTTDTTETTETTSWFGAETFYAAEPVASDFYLIYCMNNAGEKGWYVYDSVEGTFQRYLGSIHASATENETAGAAGNTEAYNQLLNELESAKKVQLMIICVAVFIVIVLVIIIVNLILRNRSDEEFDDYDDDEDDDYYDEYEFDEDEDTTSEVAQLTSEDVDDVAEDDEEDDEIEIEFYEMPQEEVTVNSVEETEDDDEIEIEFYEMTETEMTETEVTVSEEIATEESVTEDDEVEVEFYNMEELLMKEAIEPEESSKKEKEEIPVKKQETPVAVENTYVDDDDDDDDLEFIELD